MSHQSFPTNVVGICIASDLLALAAALVPAGAYLGFRAPCIRAAMTPADHGFAFKAMNLP